MDVIILKYVQLVCFSIFMRNSGDCAQLMSSSEEMNNLKVSACTANCLKTEINYVSSDRNFRSIRLQFTSLISYQKLEGCYQHCVNQTVYLDDVSTVNSLNTAAFRLFCRDSTRLVIEVENSDDDHVENEKFVYLVVIQETTMKFVDRYVYIVSGKFRKI
jgi:hypothetical protein